MSPLSFAKVFVFVVANVVVLARGGTFIIKNNEFVQDGKPMHIKAGEIHYSRVPLAVRRRKNEYETCSCAL